MTPRRNTLGLRIAKNYFILMLLTMGLLTPVILTQAARYYSAELRQSLESHSVLVADYVGRLMAEGTSELALERQILDLAKSTRSRITIISPSGRVIADSQVAAVGLENHGDRPEVREALRGRIAFSKRWSSSLGTSLLYAAAPIKDRGRISGVARVSMPLAAEQKALASLGWHILAFTVLAVILSGLAGYQLAHRLIQPILAMSRKARDMATGNFETRLGAPVTTDELAQLGADLNHLAKEFQLMLEKSAAERDEIQAVLASLSDAVIVIDRQGRVILFNSAAERAFGVAQAVVLGRPLLEAARNHELWEAFTAALNGEAARREVRLYAPQERVFAVRVAPVRRASGEIGGAVGVLDDVTELRGLERMRSEFVANVSHELKTPVTSIKGFAETLLDGALAETGTARRFVEIIDRESARLGRLVDDLLELSRIESQRVELRLEPVSLAELAAETVAFYLPTAAQRQVVVETKVPGELSRVLADRELLEHVLRNLVDNAVKYTPPGGRVWVSAAEDAGTVSVSVSDTGHGIPPEHLSRLFERFYRVDKARSREVGGTGLGLSIVKHVVERHGGRVTVESTVGEGSTFTVSLPKNPPQG